jgi:hypothetical protein
VEDGAGCGAGGGHAARRPERVGFGEEAGDLAPTGPFAGLARFADENDEEIEAVTGGTDAAVRGVTAYRCGFAEVSRKLNFSQAVPFGRFASFSDTTLSRLTSFVNGAR